MTLSSPALFDEKNPNSWRLAAVFALLGALLGLQVSPEFSLINVGISLCAGIMSLMLSFKLPRGLLTVWVIGLFGLWLSPMANLSPENLRLVFGVAIIFVSLVFQGELAIFFVGLMLSFGLILPTLSSDLKNRAVKTLLLDDSFQFLQLAVALGISLLFIRMSRARTKSLHSTLQSASLELEKTRARLGATNETVQQTRENFLGRAPTQGEVSLADTISDSPLENLNTYAASFDDVISKLRKSFADFQTRGRLEGSISGPVRFVFFAPAAGYDEKSVISVDVDGLVEGVDACLRLALESLPEIGARKREGVVRLSIRYGLRVIEISVEDNGRGMIARNPEAELKLNALKELTYAWGGTFDRLARLGVGSRTSLELRIVRERNRTYRATLKHRVPEFSQSAIVPRG